MKFCSPLDFYFPMREKFTPPYISPDLIQNISDDRLWASLLY